MNKGIFDIKMYYEAVEDIFTDSFLFVDTVTGDEYSLSCQLELINSDSDSGYSCYNVLMEGLATSVFVMFENNKEFGTVVYEVYTEHNSTISDFCITCTNNYNLAVKAVYDYLAYECYTGNIYDSSYTI